MSATNIQSQRSSANGSAEVLAVADHAERFARHLSELGRPAEAAVARGLAERLRATMHRRPCRLP